MDASSIAQTHKPGTSFLLKAVIGRENLRRTPDQILNGEA